MSCGQYFMLILGGGPGGGTGGGGIPIDDRIIDAVPRPIRKGGPVRKRRGGFSGNVCEDGAITGVDEFGNNIC